MNRLQLADQPPYEFIEPKVGRFWLWLGRLYARRTFLKQHKVAAIDVQGLDRLAIAVDAGLKRDELAGAHAPARRSAAARAA